MNSGCHCTGTHIGLCFDNMKIRSSFWHALTTTSFAARPQCTRQFFFGRPDSSGSSTTTSLAEIAAKIRDGTYHKILVVTGAGVSTSANIPDFRTPGTGLYDNLHRFHHELPYPEAIFDLDFFRRTPGPFCALARDLWPDGVRYRPTHAHAFLKLLDAKQCLLRVYTQNIDGLEVIAGVSASKMVECHGHFRTARCIDCHTPADVAVCRNTMMLEQGRAPTCTVCHGLVKPDIVFFGEELPARYGTWVGPDTRHCDLLLVMGTSLQVAPVSHIPEYVPKSCPRLLLNRELVGDFGRSSMDVFVPGNVDDR